ncbi:uncharacterized protein EV420DRAFT_79218 [Desarmillaria tabescens]|uniref:C2H2-type domain-containing protein n=1 Tax=Armillaria tabescens TaxID=1929756 RepID=A0AA39U3G4_ARMTA|nr:uncharacterized protein EV420DRAFT_79218 [Desarmillaria tabescens]KAK0469934.1 hypothetical protein EV420DRAFT_79218 [Desarmillaria tabescens]
MAFFPDSSIFNQGVDGMLLNPGASSMDTESISPAPSTVTGPYYTPTGEISFTPPPIVENLFIFGDPMFYGDFHPDITNELSYFNFYCPSLEPPAAVPAGDSMSYSGSPSPPQVANMDEDAEYDLDPEYDGNGGGSCDSMDEDASTVTLFSQPSPSSEYRDWSPSSSVSDPCTIVDSGDVGYRPSADDSSDTCCSGGDDSDYDEPATDTRKRARTPKATSESPKPKRGKKANFQQSSERWSFHDREVRVRCMYPTCDAELWSINSAVDHFHEEHAEDERPDAVRCSYLECDATGKSVGDIRRHFLSQRHEAHRFKCDACQMMFTRRDPMLRHMRNFRGRCKNRTARKSPVQKSPANKSTKKKVRARKA